MSELTILLGRDFLDDVMSQVVVTTPSAQLSPTALQSLKSGRVVAAAGEAWSKLRTLLNDIAGQGWEKVQASLNVFEDYLGRVAQELEEDAQLFRELLRDKIREHAIHFGGTGLDLGEHDERDEA